MADIGNPSFKFGGTVYDADDCIQSAQLTIGGQDVTYMCDGYEKYLSGPDSIRLNVTIALAKTDTTKAGAFARGTTGVGEFHPAGDTETYIEHTTTNATVVSYNEAANPNGVITADIVFAWDDITTGAAAA